MTTTESRLAQARDALRRADEVRIGAANLRRAVAAGDITVRDALFDDRAGPLPVDRLLMSQPKWGRVRTENALRRANIIGRRRVRDLTDRQLYVLALVTRSPYARDQVFNRRETNRRTTNANR